MQSNAYLAQPSLYNDKIIFKTDDDLWLSSLYGGQALRITTSEGHPNRPVISPNGELVAFSSSESGPSDVYLMATEGGEAERLTYVGGCQVCRWESENIIIINSSFESFHPREPFLYRLNIRTKKLTKINVGPAKYYEKNEDGVQLIGRNLGDPAYWKRYRGGTAGTLWLDKKGNGEFKQILKTIKSNISSPALIGSRIFFISDHEGIGNIYSCNLSGGNLKRHSHCEDYYIRSFSHHEGQIVYQAAGSLYHLDIKSSETREIIVSVASNFTQAKERFEPAAPYLTEYDCDDNGSQISLISRGQIFNMHPWLGAVLHGSQSGDRVKLPCIADDKKQTFTIEFTKKGEEQIVSRSLEGNKAKVLPNQPSWGKVKSISVDPKNKFIAIATWRQELWIYNLRTKKPKKISDSKKGWPEIFPYQTLEWSPDGRYLVFNADIEERKSGLMICELTKTSLPVKQLLNPILSDWSPAFSPDGRYLYFISIREFNPTMSETHFEASFPFASRPYVLILKNGDVAPWDEKKESDDSGSKKSKSKKSKKDDEVQVQIDFDGIEDRVLPLALEIGGYSRLTTAKDRILFMKRYPGPIDPIKNMWGESLPHLYCYNTKDDKEILVGEKVFDFSISTNKKWVLFDNQNALRLLEVGELNEEEDEIPVGFNKKSGKIDLSRVKVKVAPRKEWLQMYDEAWVLQREHFWTPNMSNVAWTTIYKRYKALLPKINTRREMSDLLWEMQGELGTSHCYEFDGDYYRIPPYNPLVKIGGQVKWIASEKSFQITKVFDGDSWNPFSKSPLRDYRALLKEGDKIFDVDGMTFSKEEDLNIFLNNKGGVDISFLVQRKGKRSKERVTLKGLKGQETICYRQWVEKNKEYVHKNSGGKLGYVHIPDMSLKGFSEFYRHFLNEIGKEGLVIDVRYNGGGNVSQQILKVLAQKTSGHCVSRYMGLSRYPSYSNSGALVCLTNEHAGSDGDIFSHNFKLMGLGPLIGKRTWGGVVGIWPRNLLNDGTITTQPEFSFWFNDVGWAVENYGTEPDIEVNILPQDYAKNKDPQLDRAIDEGMKRVKKLSKRPNLDIRPDLRLPELPQ